MSKLLSICIPNFNRTKCLRNCLHSIYQAKVFFKIDFEVCISDNCSTENIDEVLNEFRESLDIKLNRNKSNLGLGPNILKSVEMATGEFAWIIGNDDMILENTFKRLNELFIQNPEVDYYFINSYHLDSSYAFKYEQPFQHMNLPTNMKKFSQKKNNIKCNYFDLISPDYSFDFLLGMFLSIFRRDKWVENLDQIDHNLIKDTSIMSNIFNTFPHNIIFAKAFKNSKAFFHAEPLSIALSGERNWWKDLYPFVEAVRIPELVDVYRKNGMGYIRYLFCKNFAVRKLIFNLIKIAIMPGYNGLQYLAFKKHIINNLLYPSIYITPIYYVFRKVYKQIVNILK